MRIISVSGACSQPNATCNPTKMINAPLATRTGPAANQIVESASAIAELDCDILLSPHPFFFGMQDKLLKRDEGNPFVNNVACMIYAESALDY